MIEKNGVATQQMIRDQFPRDETVLKKPKAIIECYKEIPCNPCETSCPFDAIHVGPDINKRPQIDFDKCTGCGVCVYNCPGLAITVREYSEDSATLKLPYEFAPLPGVEQTVNIIDRNGDVIGEGTVLKVQNTKRQDFTPLIHVRTDKSHLQNAMTIEVRQ